ncbi:cell division protein FtsZ [Halobellus sp. GM3]|uniref:cell division protein FtsZ n=1 Tax=Halobellus sp. GM3 TaxID=3458410 RepID=UPI00403D7C94
MGAGQAGTQIVDQVFAHDNIDLRAEALAFNSTIQDLERLNNIPQERWYGVSRNQGLVSGTARGFEEQVTGGFGQTPSASDQVMKRNEGEVQRVLDELYLEMEADPSTLQYAFIFLGLGGGTGCGIAPHLAREIRAYSQSEMDIIAVAVLPNTKLIEGGGSADDDAVDQQITQCENTVYGLDNLEEEVESIMLVDNQRLALDVAEGNEYSEYNRYVADAFLDIVLGAERERTDVDLDVQMQDVDLQDLVRFIDGDGFQAGYATLGRGVRQTESLLGYLLPGKIGRQPIRETGLIADSIDKQTLDGFSPNDATSAVAVAQAPGWCWDEKEISLGSVYDELGYYCANVNAGWAVTNRKLASVTTAFRFDREDVGRIAEIERIAAQEGSS